MIQICLFEIKLRMRMISTYIYFAMYLVFAFIMLFAAGGGIEGKVISFGNSPLQWANSPLSLLHFFTTINIFMVIIIAAIMGRSVYKDYSLRTYQLFFTTPVSKAQYLFGRFIAAMAILLFISLRFMVTPVKAGGVDNDSNLSN